MNYPLILAALYTVAFWVAVGAGIYAHRAAQSGVWEMVK